MIPILKGAQVPEKGQEMVMKFFKDLGGAPVVIAVTIDKLEDPGMMEPLSSPAPPSCRTCCSPPTPRAWAPAG